MNMKNVHLIQLLFATWVILIIITILILTLIIQVGSNTPILFGITTEEQEVRVMLSGKIMIEHLGKSNQFQGHISSRMSYHH